MFCNVRRAPGQEYLKSTLGELVNEVAEQKELALEINPLKVLLTAYTVNSHFCEHPLVSLTERVRNSRNLFQSCICNLFFPGIYLLSVLSWCLY